PDDPCRRANGAAGHRGVDLAFVLDAGARRGLRGTFNPGSAAPVLALAGEPSPRHAPLPNAIFIPPSLPPTGPTAPPPTSPPPDPSPTTTFVLHVTKAGQGDGIVQSAPAGIVCAPTCPHTFPATPHVPLTPPPPTP